MNAALNPDPTSEQRKQSLLLDVLIRAGLILALVILCFKIFAPFLSLMVWALILAVAIYPVQQWLARKLGGRQGLAATLITLIGAVVIVSPSAALLDRSATRCGNWCMVCRRIRCRSRLLVPASRSGQWSARRSTAPGRKRTPTCQACEEHAAKNR
jgi:hypothetical protein